MSAMTGFTWKSLKKSRVRTLVTIAGIALAAALLTAVLTSYTSLVGYGYKSQVHQSGTWMSCALIDEEDAAQQLEEARRAPDVGTMAVTYDKGFAALDEEQQRKLGTYLTVLAFEGDVEEVCAIRPSEGRMPQSPDEILLPAVWGSQQPVDLGDTVTLNVGRRAVTAVPAEADRPEDVMAYSAYDVYGEDPQEAEYFLEVGSTLDSSMGLITDQDGYEEQVVDARTRTYRVVGFYEGYFHAGAGNAGLCAFVGYDGEAAPLAAAYLTLSGVGNSDEVVERTQELFPGDTVITNTGLLRFMGIRGGGAIWDTFFGLVAVLGIVVVAACISLIYNAFAISVAERMRQFGLLSSIGASRRQLRGGVLFEACLVAVVGIPAGILLGIGGCAAVFAALSPSLMKVLGGEVPFDVTVQPWALLAAALISLAAVLVSAFIPAWRAGRVVAVDALRQNPESRVTKRGIRKAARCTSPSRLWRRRSAAGRLFGMGGTLASVNNSRGAGKGAVASISLALAIVLLMTAGSLDMFLGNLVNAADTQSRFDFGVNVAFDDRRQSDAADGVQGGAAGFSGAASTSAESAAETQAGEAPQGPEDDAAAGAEDSSDPAIAQAAVDDEVLWEAVYADVASVQGVEPLGWYCYDSMPAVIPASVAGAAFSDGQIEGYAPAGALGDGDYGTYAYVFYLQDGAFDAYARENGIDPTPFHGAASPKAIGVRTFNGENGTSYLQLPIFDGTGSLDLLVGGTDAAGAPVKYAATYREGEDGEATVAFEPYRLDDDSPVLSEEEAEAVVADMRTVEVAALADNPPDTVNLMGYVELVMPLSQRQSAPLPLAMPHYEAAFDALGEDHLILAEDLREALESSLGERVNDKDIMYYFVNDYLEDADVSGTIALLVKVFCLLFTGILTLIAMANVFNTMTNGLILRRREFAVMKSVGLSDRSFRSMVTCECIRYGIRGLIPGLLVSAGISFLLYSMVSLSLIGVAFTFPWAYAAAAVGLTGLTMAVAVAYGMRRCRSDSIVEALRMDNA